MARILVTGDTESLAPRMLLERLVETIRNDGHDAALTSGLQDPAGEIREADAVVALLDGGAPGASAIVAYAHANHKPVLGCVGVGAHAPRFVKGLCTQVAEVRKGSEIPAVLEAFYEKIRPFAGRLVRDDVPRLVKEAGHQVKFRQVEPPNLPSFLKRKIAEEAQALAAASGGREKEELADLLEALEAFIAARGLDRDELKRIKAHKHDERGGFTKGYVVEAAITQGGQGPDVHAVDEEGARVAAKGTGAAKSERAGPGRAQGKAPIAGRPPAKGYAGPVWEADDAVPVSEASAARTGPEHGRDVEDDEEDDVGRRDVHAQLHDI